MSYKFKADLSEIKPIRPAWTLGLVDVWGLNISLFGGYILMTSGSYDRYLRQGGETSTMWHEMWHRKQKLAWGLFHFAFWYYASRRRRLMWEREAYRVTIAWWINRVGDANRAFRTSIAKSMSSWKYGWMTSREEAEAWVEGLRKDILQAREDGELSFTNTAPRAGR